MQDKLTSMKKIVEYEKELKDFASEHKRLNDDIRSSKASNSLVHACVTGLFSDKQYMIELREQAVAEERE